MSLDKDTKIFDDKSFSDLAKDIYEQKGKKDKLIDSLISELRPLIKNIGDAGILVPLVREYLDMGVKNDEMLVKLVAIIQKLIAITNKENSADGDSVGLNKEERELLLKEAQEIRDKGFPKSS